MGAVFLQDIRLNVLIRLTCTRTTDDKNIGGTVTLFIVQTKPDIFTVLNAEQHIIVVIVRRDLSYLHIPSLPFHKSVLIFLERTVIHEFCISMLKFHYPRKST